MFIYHLNNNGEQTPETMLYLLARCVKGAVRYGRSGNFNQSPDKRRHGTNPDNMERNIFQVSGLLKGKSSFMAMDFREILELAKPGDLIYMDPPYQGVSNVRDNRYFAGVSFVEFVESIEQLNRRKVDYIISYDGLCGNKAYGEELPEYLKCTRILLKAGPSAQATLLGRKEQTLEALYISENLSLDLPIEPEQLSIWEVAV
jgi:DNA adenine methylase